MIITLILAAAVAVPSPICAKLMGDFVKNDSDMAFAHRVNIQMLEVARVLKEPTGRPFDRIAEDDERYKLQGDRIMTLMLAHKCPPPDHVTGSPVSGAQ
jgi:hypothetical protein